MGQEPVIEPRPELNQLRQDPPLMEVGKVLEHAAAAAGHTGVAKSQE